MDKSEVFAAIARLRRYTWPHSLGNDVLTVIEAYEELVTSVTNAEITAVTAPKRDRAEYMRQYRAKKAAAKS
jgi:hypothetical protein